MKIKRENWKRFAEKFGLRHQEFMKGKRILIVDDVISTGGSLRAVEELVLQAGGIVA